jgi:hypothetical protein
MRLDMLRVEQPAVQGRSEPLDREWFRWLRDLLAELSRISAKAWNASTSEALQLPSMTTAERDDIDAENGMVIYNNSTDAVQAYVAGSWVDL